METLFLCKDKVVYIRYRGTLSLVEVTAIYSRESQQAMQL